MGKTFYDYDVAFSFLKEDEDLALQVRDLLEGRVRSFIPSRKAEGAPVADFDQPVARIFESQARIVTVLYRGKWGRTVSTRVEETAIRNRAHEEGYEFVLLIPLESPPSLPPWLPRKQAWVGFDRWGPKGIAAVVEARVQQAGGKGQEWTPLEHAQRIALETVFEKERQSFLCSQEGLDSAQSELSKLFDEIGALSKEITEVTQSLILRIDRDENRLILSTHGLSMDLAWFLAHLGTLEPSSLSVMLWRGLLSVHGAAFEKPRRLERREFSFDRTLSGELGWREPEGEGRFLSTADLAEECMTLLLARVHKDQGGE